MEFSTQMLERLFKHNIMPLFILDKTGEIIAFNLKFQEVTRYSEQELVGKSLTTIFQPEKEEEKQKFALMEYGFFKESQAHDVVMISRDSEKRYVRLWIDAQFDDELSLAAVEDYSDKRTMELQLADQNEKLLKMTAELSDFNHRLEIKVQERTIELSKANEEIKILLERKNQFINELAHDLRTPLPPITYLTESLKSDIKDPTVQKDLKIMEDNARYLKLLVEDILKLARIDNNKVEFNYEEADIGEIAGIVSQNNSITFKKLGMTLENKIPKGMPKVYIDKLRITEVFENLVMNSTKFMDKGGKLEFHAVEDDKLIRVSVKDNGIGIDKDQISKLFQEFYKIDSARNPKSGTGLGLSICKRLVEKHGGKIWAESEGVGKGTSIVFTLPISKYVQKEPRQEVDQPEDAKYLEKLAKIQEKMKR